MEREGVLELVAALDSETANAIRDVIRRHDDGQVWPEEAVDMFKRLFEKMEREHRDMDAFQKIRHNGLLHKVHLYLDFSIGGFALLGLAALLFGFEGLINTFFEVDLWFHVSVIVMTFGMIVLERVLHRRKHSGVLH